MGSKNSIRVTITGNENGFGFAVEGSSLEAIENYDERFKISLIGDILGIPGEIKKACMSLHEYKTGHASAPSPDIYLAGVEEVEATYQKMLSYLNKPTGEILQEAMEKWLL